MNSTTYAPPGSNFKPLSSSAARIHSCLDPIESRQSDFPPESASEPVTGEIFDTPLPTRPANPETPPSKSSENRTVFPNSGARAAACARAEGRAASGAGSGESDRAGAPASHADRAAKQTADANGIITFLFFIRANVFGAGKRRDLTAEPARGERRRRRKDPERRRKRRGFGHGIDESSRTARGTVQEKLPSHFVAELVVGCENAGVEFLLKIAEIKDDYLLRGKILRGEHNFHLAWRRDGEGVRADFALIKN